MAFTITYKTFDTLAEAEADITATQTSIDNQDFVEINPARSPIDHSRVCAVYQGDTAFYETNEERDEIIARFRELYEEWLGDWWIITNTATGAETTISTFATRLANRHREERREVFRTTLDDLNPLWYNSLTPTQQTELATWRQAWLDYPSTGIRPDNLEIFN